jgi:hypothetical protein
MFAHREWAERDAPMLRDQELVGLVVAEAGERLNGSLEHALYLLQRDGYPTHFRFLYQPFVGVVSAEAEGMIETARLRVKLGESPLPPNPGQELREEVDALVAHVQALVEELPQGDDNIKLVAVAEFLRFNQWAESAGISLEELLDDVGTTVAPSATLSGTEIVQCLDRVRPTHPPQLAS